MLKITQNLMSCFLSLTYLSPIRETEVQIERDGVGEREGERKKNTVNENNREVLQQIINSQIMNWDIGKK